MNPLKKEVELLLQQKGDINKRNKYGETLLHLAVDRNDIETIKLLVCHGIDVNARSKNGSIVIPKVSDKNIMYF